MNWKIITASVLLLPIYLWLVCVLPVPASVSEYAEHMATYGEHYEPYGYHVPPAVEKPQAAGIVENWDADFLIVTSVIAWLPPDHVPRDRPPPLFYSLSHSLRAPPTLIPA